MGTMIRFGAVLAGVTLASGMAFAGTQLPAGYGGGFVPPTANDLKVELGVAKNLNKLAAAVSKCHTKGVGNVIKLKPAGVVACTNSAVGKYNLLIPKLVGAACINSSAQTSIGANVAGLVASFDSTIWCDGSTPLSGPDFQGGFVPPAAPSPSFKAESLISGTLIKHTGAVAKCVAKGVGNITKSLSLPDGGLNTCLNDPLKGAAAKTAASLAKITGVPSCYTGPTDLPSLESLVTGLTLSFNSPVLCASPSGAFIN
jgi:hypothetical protein